MIGIALIGGVLVGVAVLFALRAIALPSRGSAGLEQIQSYGYHAAPLDATGAEERPRRGFGELSRSLGDYVFSRSTKLREGDVRSQLQQAGLYTLSPAQFTGYRVAAGIAAGAVVFLLGASGGRSMAVIIVTSVAAAAAGFRLPDLMLQRRIQSRHEDIDVQMPQLVDLLVVTVESGLALSRSLQIAADHLEAPLGDELRLALKEEEMGRATGEALNGMLSRCDTPSMRSFVRSMTQGEQLGVSIGDILRSLAREMRVRRRQGAEERAHKAPVKILFPLVGLIFPALFLVLLYPAVHSLLQGLS